MIDILYLAWHRPEYTAASLAALATNTDWTIVRRLIIYTDGDLMREGYVARSPIPFEVIEYNLERHGGPVAVMNHFLTQYEPAPWFAKIDNDVVLPPGWLEASQQVLHNQPTVDLLGLEVKHPVVYPARLAASPDDVAAWFCRPEVRREPYREAIPTDHIGGVGLMRTSVFTDLPQADGRLGFSDWQIKHPGVVKAWINPALPVILLDRIPVEPWESFGKEYEARGYQRPWKHYTADDSKIWEWWL